MNHIETEVVKETLLRRKLSELQLEGEKMYQLDKEVIEETNKVLDQLLVLKSDSKFHPDCSVVLNHHFSRRNDPVN